MTIKITNTNTNTNTNKKNRSSRTHAILVVLLGLVLIYINNNYLSKVNNDNNNGNNGNNGNTKTRNSPQEMEMLSTMAASAPSQNKAESESETATSTSTSTSTSTKNFKSNGNNDGNGNNGNGNGNNDEYQSYLQELVQQHLAMNASSSSGQGLPIIGHRPKPPHELTLGAFIHIGKTGGSTLSSQLHYGCHSFAINRCYNKVVIANETYISKLTTYYHSPAFHDQGKNAGLFSKNGNGKKHEFYLFTARDPYERTISSYLYSHPENVKAERPNLRNKPSKYAEYFTCAPTLEKFAFLLSGYYDDDNNNDNNNNDKNKNKQGNNNNNSNTSTIVFNITTNNNSTEISDENVCNDMFHYSSRGRSENIPKHLRMDITFVVRNLFGYYHPKDASAIKVKATTNTITNHKQLLYEDGNDNNNDNININWNNKTILVVRTKQMNDDWISANRYLGQDDPISVPTIKIRDSTTVRRPIGGALELSNEGRKNICLYLREEYYVYFGLLWKAGNINAEELAESLYIARKNCGSWLDFGSSESLLS